VARNRDPARAARPYGLRSALTCAARTPYRQRRQVVSDERPFYRDLLVPTCGPRPAAQLVGYVGYVGSLNTLWLDSGGEVWSVLAGMTSWR
jgi:hypothetical protein